MAEPQKAKKQSDGGLWKQSNDIGDFYFGKLTVNGVTHSFRAYPNTFKQEGEKTPDFRITLFTDKPAAPAQAPATAVKPRPVAAGKPKTATVAQSAPTAEPEGDVPF